MTDLSVYEKIQTSSLLDDRFMSVVFEKKEFAASLIEQILGLKNVVVDSVKTQYTFTHLSSRKAVLDILAKSDGKYYNIEVHRSHKQVLEKARYYSSSMDVVLTSSGGKDILLPEVIIIFICEKDIFKLGLVQYTIQPTITKLLEPIDMGQQLYIFNTEADDPSHPFYDLMAISKIVIQMKQGSASYQTTWEI